MATAAAGSSNTDESDSDGAAAWARDSADESDNEAEEAPAASGVARRKRYRRTALAGQKDADVSKDSWRTPVRRRLLRKDRRATLEMLTSDDDVNAYQETRPSSYREPATRRSLHETAPHLKSSFETLYNPELNHLNAAPELLASSSSESLASETVEALTDGTWQLACGPKLSSPYLDVSRRPAVNSRMTSEQAEFKHDGLGQQDGKGFLQQTGATSGEMWTEFGGKSPAVVDGGFAAPASRQSQPVNLSIRLSKPSLQVSAGAPVRSNGSIGVNVEIELSRSTAPAPPAAMDDPPVAEQLIKSFKEPGQSAGLPVKPPLLPDKPTPAGSTRGRRVLPAVPDSADLEVSDLLRGDAAPASGAADAASRPKSAVDILVPKGRCSSIQQLPSSTVSEQLRSLFHNPSPHIMLQRAATQQTQPQPPRTAREELGLGADLSKASHKYAPLRASHGSHQPQHPQPANSVGSGRQSAVQMLMSRQQPTPNSLASTPQQPAELPQRQSQESLRPSQSMRKEAHTRAAASQAASLNGPRRHLNSQVAHNSSAIHGPVRHEPRRASPFVFSNQPRSSPAPPTPHDQLRREQSAVQALFHAPPSPVRGPKIEPHLAPFNAAARTAVYSPQLAAPTKQNRSPTQAPPLPPRRAKQITGERQALSAQHPMQTQSAVEQLCRRVQQEPERHRVLPTHQLQAPPPPDDIGGSGEEDSGCYQSSGEYLLAKEPTRAAAGSPANPTRIQTNPRTNGRAAAPEPERGQAPRGAHLPPNAVRVLPRMDSAEVGELRRVLAIRREQAAAAFKGGERPEDAVEGLERMCRDMRLHDDQLLDGAERRDTAMRVQARMQSLRTSQGWPAASSAERRGRPPQIRSTNHQSWQVPADVSHRPQQNALGVKARMTAPEVKSEFHRRVGPTGSQPPNQQDLRISNALLHPGEQETGPEVIL